MADKNITSIADMVKELKAVSDPKRGPAWFRGHADSSWKLQPNYDRLQKPAKETELLSRFRQNANLLLSHAPALPNDFGWMFLMQHYGVPTRLLDWSESPLSAKKLRQYRLPEPRCTAQTYIDLPLNTANERQTALDFIYDACLFC